MKKKILIIGGIVVAVVIIIAIIIFANSGNKQAKVEGVDFSTTDGLSAFIDEVYQPLGEQLPTLVTSVIDLSNIDSLKYYTGLTDNKGIEYAVASEPMMSSQAYSLVLLKVSDDTDIEKMKQDIFDKIDTRKWICVEADKKFVTDYDRTIILFMSNQNWADIVYNRIKEILGKSIGNELTETSTQDIQLEDEIIPDTDTVQ